MSEYIWRDCKKQPPLVDDGELVLMDSNGKFWVGFCKITSDGVSYFANNAEPLKNDFVKYARIEKLLALGSELECTRTMLDKGMEHITGLNNMIESWYKLLQSDKDASTKYAILKSAISAYVENKGGDND